MSKISNFLKHKKAGKKADAITTEAAPKPELVEEPKEEWVKDVVDVEIVPVAVRKVDGASDYEDEEIDLPSSMVKSNFEWKKAEDDKAAAAAKLEAEQQQAEKAQEDIPILFKLKQRIAKSEAWVTLEAAAEMSKVEHDKPEAVARTASTVSAKRTKKEKSRPLILTPSKVGDDLITTLSSKDIWAVIQPWTRGKFLQAPVA